MKKFICCVCFCSVTASYAALTTIDLNTSNYSCNGIKIVDNMEQAVLKQNCKKYSIKRSYTVHGENDIDNNQDHQVSSTQLVTINNKQSSHKSTQVTRVSFFSDQGRKMECFFEDGKLYKCKDS